jgi:hypothetical protein
MPVRVRQFACMLLVVVAFHLMSLHQWSFTCLPIVIISASVGRIVCTVCALLVQTEVVQRTEAVLGDLDPAMLRSLRLRVTGIFAVLCMSQVRRWEMMPFSASRVRRKTGRVCILTQEGSAVRGRTPSKTIRD